MAGFTNLNNLILNFANGVVKNTGYLMFTLAVVAFFFGIVQFIWSARQGAEGKGIQKGTQFMKWGLIAIFVMFSIWGIVKFAQGVFGIQGDNTIIVPSLNFTQSGASGANATGVNGNLFPTGGSSVTGITTSGIQTQAQANQVRDYCIANGGNSTDCTNAANAALANTTAANAIKNASATKVTTQAEADQAVQACQKKGGTPAGCEAAVKAALANAGKKDFGYSCTDSTECKTGMYCDYNNICSKAAAGEKTAGYSCIDSTECASGLYCDYNNTCSKAAAGEKTAGYSCLDSTECASGLYCDSNNTCSKAAANEKANGYSCEASSECQSGFCDPADDTCSAVGSGGSTDTSGGTNYDNNAVWGSGATDTQNTGVSECVSDNEGSVTCPM